jgi:hypothetical protein
MILQRVLSAQSLFKSPHQEAEFATVLQWFCNDPAIEVTRISNFGVDTTGILQIHCKSEPEV